MIVIRKSEERGRTRMDWLNSKHSFSFGHYYDSQHSGYGSLRVINEDIVSPGQGFDMHDHNNMEIISYVISGSLTHKDSLGNGSTIVPGDVQRMSAGRGIQHSEFNASDKEPVHFLQIWIIPERKGIIPSYQQKNFSSLRKPGQLLLVGSRTGRHDSITIHQDVDMYVLDLTAEQSFTYKSEKGRRLWAQIVDGSISINQQNLHQGDGASITDTGNIIFTAKQKAEIIIFSFPN